uniref:Nuclear receptor domain-containing protein n=1 Tax=Meloidogyne javanica TaxID=6303 RepID=A0A915M852_MELJA
MSLTDYINRGLNEVMENETLQNLEDGIDIEENNEENGNKKVEGDKNKNLKNRKRSAKTKRNVNPAPTECCICERIASGYLFYGVNCCDGRFKYINVCKSCRFDKCILKGMYIQTTKGRQPEKVLEIQTMIQNKRRELASKGKYVQGKSSNNCAVEETNFVDLQKSLIAAQNKQSLDYLLTVEQNACRTRASGIDECHYNSSCNSLASLLTRKENLIAMKHMIGLQKYPKSGRDPIEGHRVFSNRPKPMTDGLLITIILIKTITIPIASLNIRYYCSTLLSETVIWPNGFPIKNIYNSNIYKEDMTINRLIKKTFDDSMVPFNRLQLNKEEFVILRAILSSHFVSCDLSQYGRQLLLTEAEKYSDMLMKMLQNHYGPLPGAKRYAELLHLIEFCFNCANNHSLFLNYVAYVTDRDYFHNSMPEALVDISLGCKT